MVSLTLARAAVFGATSAIGCAAVSNTGAVASAPVTGVPQADTAGLALLPPGYGSLRQDDLSLHIDAGTVLVRALPLDEGLIRLLTPDSYRALHDLKEGSRVQLDAMARRYGGRPVSVWLVSFYGVEPNARFTPGDLIITSGGRLSAVRHAIAHRRLWRKPAEAARNSERALCVRRRCAGESAGIHRL